MPSHPRLPPAVPLCIAHGQLIQRFGKGAASTEGIDTAKAMHRQQQLDRPTDTRLFPQTTLTVTMHATALLSTTRTHGSAPTRVRLDDEFGAGRDDAFDLIRSSQGGKNLGKDHHSFSFVRRPHSQACGGFSLSYHLSTKLDEEPHLAPMAPCCIPLLNFIK